MNKVHLLLFLLFPYSTEGYCLRSIFQATNQLFLILQALAGGGEGDENEEPKAFKWRKTAHCSFSSLAAYSFWSPNCYVVSFIVHFELEFIFSEKLGQI